MMLQHDPPFDHRSSRRALLLVAKAILHLLTRYAAQTGTNNIDLLQATMRAFDIVACTGPRPRVTREDREAIARLPANQGFRAFLLHARLVSTLTELSLAVSRLDQSHEDIQMVIKLTERCRELLSDTVA